MRGGGRFGWWSRAWAPSSLSRVNRRETVEQAAAQWAKDLTDESGRNRLLYYRDLRVGTLDLAEADPKTVGRLRNGQKVQLSQLFPAPVVGDHLTLEFEDSTGSDGQDLMAEAIKRARSISRKAQEYFEEKGIQTLFLGWGMATWTAQATKATPAAPVLLCPIGLHRKGTAETDYDFELAGEWSLNEALLQHLANEYQVNVSGEDLMDPYGDGEQISPDEEQAIFAELSKRASHVPGFDIAERLIAGNFMYTKMPMVNDIKKNLDALTNHDLIAALAGDEEAVESVRLHSDLPIDSLLPDTLSPADEFLVLNADSSQNLAINAALSGYSPVTSFRATPRHCTKRESRGDFHILTCYQNFCDWRHLSIPLGSNPSRRCVRLWPNWMRPQLNRCDETSKIGLTYLSLSAPADHHGLALTFLRRGRPESHSTCVLG